MHNTWIVTCVLGSDMKKWHSDLYHGVVNVTIPHMGAIVPHHLPKGADRKGSHSPAN